MQSISVSEINKLQAHINERLQGRTDWSFSISILEMTMTHDSPPFFGGGTGWQGTPNGPKCNQLDVRIHASGFLANIYEFYWQEKNTNKNSSMVGIDDLIQQFDEAYAYFQQNKRASLAFEIKEKKQALAKLQKQQKALFPDL